MNLQNDSRTRIRWLVLALLASAGSFAHASASGDASAKPGAQPLDPATGALHGNVTTDGRTALANAHLSLCRIADFTCGTFAADAEGAFRIASLPTGLYQLGPAQPSLKSEPRMVEIVAHNDTAADLTVQPASPTPPKDNGFFHRLGRAYLNDWGGNAPVEITPEARRGTPPPLASPPYPASDWPIGGTVVIGAPDGQSYPLMEAIDHNKGINKIYGWIEVGGNGSTSNKTNAQKGIAANAPAAYDVYSNIIQLDQAALYFERTEDTAQKTHFDWGYRLTLLYGTDYRYTTSHGMLSQQLLVKNAQYGFDPVMFYYDAYFPKVADGLVLRVGRYVSLPDIEAQLAPNNYTYSHSILYTYDCYTMFGANATLKVNDHWTVQAGISPGCDTMPWTTDAKLTGNVCATYTWSNGGNALNMCDNTINDGKYAYNNLTAFYLTQYHRISATWHTDTEGWYQYMKEVPNMYWYNSSGAFANTPATPYPEVTGAGVNLNFGAVCQDPTAPAAQQSSRCYAPEWAIVNYVEHNFWNNTASLNIRNEFVDDIKGQRTGTPARYEEHMVGFDFWAGSTITFRPEVSYTRCYTKYTTGYGKPVSCTDISPGSSIASDESSSRGNGTIPTGLGKTQALTLAGDLIWHF